MDTTLYIKNMVCPRCIEAVQDILSTEKIELIHVKLGKAKIKSKLTKIQLEKVEKTLSERGFELLKDKTKKTIDQIKSVIIELIHHSDHTLANINFSDYIADQLNVEYKKLSTLFSSSENTTIEKFIIAQKIERVKELISYNELSMSEISYSMGYSSVQYLSNQFKKITGVTPSQYANLNTKKRETLDNL